MRFVIFSLPRSRSAWLSRFLSYRGLAVGHDIGLDCASLDNFVVRLSELVGTVETGAVLGANRLLEEQPNLRVAVIRRPLVEVARSLERQGIQPHLLDLGYKAWLLNQLAKRPGVLVLDYPDLNNPAACEELFEHCLGEAFDLAWWEQLASVNIQVNVQEQLQKAAANFPALRMIRAELTEPRAVEGDVVISAEPLGSILLDALPLAKQHSAEVSAAGLPPFNLDLDIMARLWNSGHMLILGARRGRELVGYITFNVSFDVESYGNLQAEQGAWFVKDEAPPNVGRDLFLLGLDLLRKHSVAYVWPHHRLQGRGANLGKFFQRHGGVEVQHGYYIPLGEPNA